MRRCWNSLWILVFVLKTEILLYRPGWPPPSASRVLGLQVCAPRAIHTAFVKNFPEPVVLELSQQRREDCFKVKVNNWSTWKKKKDREGKKGN